MTEPSETVPPRKPKKGGYGRPFPKGVSGNPGGQSREKRAFLERLTTDDADEVYKAFMALVREGNAPAVIRAVEYLAGRPKNADEDNAAIRASGKLPLTREEMLEILRAP